MPALYSAEELAIQDVVAFNRVSAKPELTTEEEAWICLEGALGEQDPAHQGHMFTQGIKRFETLSMKPGKANWSARLVMNALPAYEGRMRGGQLSEVFFLNQSKRFAETAIEFAENGSRIFCGEALVLGFLALDQELAFPGSLRQRLSPSFPQYGHNVEVVKQGMNIPIDTQHQYARSASVAGLPIDLLIQREAKRHFTQPALRADKRLHGVPDAKKLLALTAHLIIANVQDDSLDYAYGFFTQVQYMVRMNIAAFRRDQFGLHTKTSS